MAARNSSRKSSPAKTLEGRENQLISLATDLAERQLRDGSASSQVMTHYLKLGTTREKLEQERLQHENLLLAAKREQIANAERMDKMYEKALNAMREYSGQPPEDDSDGDYDDY